MLEIEKLTYMQIAPIYVCILKVVAKYSRHIFNQSVKFMKKKHPWSFFMLFKQVVWGNNVHKPRIEEHTKRYTLWSI